MTKIFNNNWPIWLILILSIFIIWPIFVPGYFSHHDDLQVMRIFEMRKCIIDLQIPCRWVPDMGYGNGFPLFNYYGVLPYYIGAVLSFVLGFVGAAKTLFLIPLILGGISMYFLAKEFGGKWVGLTGATLYMFAPYRSLDTYVRGAVSESFALSIIPLVFYFGLKVSKEKSIFNFSGFSLSLGAFLITHNIMTLLFAPLILLFLIYLKFVLKTNNFRLIIKSLALGIGLSAFFLFPAFLEKHLVQTDTLTRFDLDFRVHFVTIKQLFLKRDFGYGASILGPNDTLSFQIGWPHWWLVAVSVLFFLKKRTVLLFGLMIVFLISIFMTHNKSGFIWEKIGILRYTQFPWRFLSISIFSSSLIGGLLVGNFKSSWQKPLAILIIILTIILNFNYFKPDKFYSLTDQQKLSGVLWDLQRKAAVLDFLPKGAYEPNEPAPLLPQIMDGQAKVSDFQVKSNSWKFKVDVNETSKIEVPVFDFPNWQVYQNGKKVVHQQDNLLRRIEFSLEPGSFKVEGKLQDTPIRTLSNLLTFLSIGTIIYLIYAKKCQ